MKLKRHSTQDYHQNKIPDGFQNFEENETTFSHMLRESHLYLKNRPFGAAFFQATKKHALRGKNPMHVVEIGAGIGHVADSFIQAWCKASPVAQKKGSYTIFDLAPELIAAQKKQLAKARVRPQWRTTDISQLAESALPKKVDLILANEMLADLEVLEITPTSEAKPEGSDDDVRSWNAIPAPRKAICSTFLKKNRRVLYPTGLERMLESLHQQMEPGATLVLTEYFSETPGGSFVTHLPGHLEFSLDLDLVMSIGRDIGFTVQNLSLIDFLEMQFNAPVISRLAARILSNNVHSELSASLPLTPQQLQPKIQTSKNLPVDFFSRSGWLNFWSEFEVLILKKLNPVHPTRHPDVGLVERKPGESHLIRLHPAQLFKLNPTGQWIWQQIDGKTSVRQMAKRMEREFGIGSADSLNDVETFLKELRAARIIHG